MLLTKLEIKGFKSFAEKSVLNFDEGVTGIVGPNGCGKSNVVDAIRWVLGEQKIKSLRSDKMENIIFNGTKNRHPAPLAQVSLSFDNHKAILPSEYATVTISRKLYRSGESEYFINEIRCRLRDILNLFLDTGIGSDSYNIIELKKVDDILSDKDNSRRDLFEKAAGIAKFKSRKKETLARLEVVDSDLDRIGDLLYEIEKNLKTLERQAKQAEKYLELKEDYKKHSLIYAKLILEKNKEVYQEINEKIKQELYLKSQLMSELEQTEKLLDNRKAQLQVAEKLFSELQRSLNEHKGQLKTTENEIHIKKEKIAFLNEKNEVIRRQISENLEKQVRIKEKIGKIEKEKSELETELVAKDRALVKLGSELENTKKILAEKQIKLKSNEENQRQKQNLLFQLKKEAEVQHTRLYSFQQELEQLCANADKQHTELAAYEGEIEKLTSLLEYTQKELDELQQREERKLLEIAGMENDIESLRQELAEYQRSLDAKKNELELIRSLEESMEGFPDAIKFLYKNKNWDEIEFPLLSDVISCDEHYRTAIESYLEPWLNYYVVTTEMEALRAIQLLKDEEKGKASFFILDQLLDSEMLEISRDVAEKRKPFSQQQANLFLGVINPVNLDKGEKIWALNVADYKPEYEILAIYLLKDLYIVEEDWVLELTDLKNNYVSKKGNLIQRNFSLTGGSTGAMEGKRIGRNQTMQRLTAEIEELQRLLKEATESYQFKKANLQSLKENKTFKDAIKQTQEEVNQLIENYVNVRGKKEQLEKVLEQSQPRQEEIRNRMAKVSEEMDLLNPKLENEEFAMQQIQLQIGELKELLAGEEEQVTLLHKSFNEDHIQLLQVKNKAQGLEKELQFDQESLSESREILDRNEQELRQIETDLELQLEQLEQLENRYQEYQNITPGSEQDLIESEKNYYSLRSEITELEKNNKEQHKHKDASEEILTALYNKHHEIELQLTGIKERLSIEFQINPEELMRSQDVRAEGLEEELLKFKIDETRLKIERLGVVNPMAMDAYLEMKERFDFISIQKADLVKSKDSLLKTIHETEAYATQAFMHSFESIRENFIKVFRSLFNEGDNVDLVLNNPEAPLESGIDILAQPKGKRPLTIEQLSGGEKTLTATSLLFALYLLKPAPFCIFDEVDAPLDDANTDKFNNIIRNFSVDSQFIIVTHNKRTMAATDVMYGITMIEEGVSSVVPVDLRTLETVE